MFWTDKRIFRALVDVGTVSSIALVVEETIVTCTVECSVGVGTVGVNRAIVVASRALIDVSTTSISDIAVAIPSFNAVAFKASLVVNADGLSMAVMRKINIYTLVDIVTVQSRNAESVSISPTEIASTVVASDCICTFGIIVALVRKDNALTLIDVLTVSWKTKSISLSETSNASTSE